MASFYAETLARLALPLDTRVLVVCGGTFDRDVFFSLGFQNVTISNVDERVKGHEFAPYAWSFQDAESLSFADGSFDFVVVHAGLHHCASPHRALLEMYRVARKGVLCFEARDNMLIRVAKRLGVVPDYELGAVRAHQFRWGGVRNTCVPNYVYRWTENEVQKTVASYAPHARHVIQFFYGLQVPPGRLPLSRYAGLRWTETAAQRTVRVVARVLPGQCNLFAFFIQKPLDTELFPWLKSRTEFNEAYAGLG